MMKQLQALQSFIKEVLISEMAFGGAVGKVANMHQYPDNPESKENFAALEKFHSSKKYLDDATRNFANIGPNIWIIPSFERSYTGLGNSRLEIIPYKEAIPWLLKSEIGLSEEDIKNGIVPSPENEEKRFQNIQKHLENGGTIIISSSSSLRKDFLPTSWMILHAIVDDIATRNTNNVHQEILDAWSYELFDFEKIIIGQLSVLMKNASNNIENQIFALKKNNPELFKELKNLSHSIWSTDSLFLAYCLARRDLMTMKSARKQILAPNSFNDIYAETFVQSLTHSKQFHFNWENAHSVINNALREFSLPFNDSNYPIYGHGKNIDTVDFSQAPEVLKTLHDLYVKMYKTIEKYLVQYEDKVKSLRDPTLDLVNKLLEGKIVRIAIFD
jgi:hypothetical protein